MMLNAESIKELLQNQKDIVGIIPTKMLIPPEINAFCIKKYGVPADVLYREIIKSANE